MRETIRRAIPILITVVMLFSLGGVAFADTLTLPAAIKTIEEEAFCGDSSLDEVVLPEGATTIGKRAFADSSLKRIDIPGTVTEIADDAFAGTTDLTIHAEAGTYAVDYARAHGITLDSNIEPGLTASSSAVGYSRSEPTSPYAVQYFVTAGESFTAVIRATAEIGRLHYQWFIDGALDEGQTGNRYTVAVERHYSIKGVVSDDYGNYIEFLFEVGPETHLTAHGDNWQSTVRAAGEPATMTVEASCDDGSPTYQWYRLEQQENEDGTWSSEPVEIAGATGKSYTVKAVNSYAEYKCLVSDSFGNTVQVWFSATVETNLTASASNGQNSVKVNAGETVELAVTANCDVQPLSYQWYLEGVTDEGYYTQIPLEGETSPSFRTVVERAKDYLCRVSDKYGNTAYVWFGVGVENHLTASASQTYYRVNVGESVQLSVTAQADQLPLSYRWIRQERVDDGNGNWHYETVTLAGATGSTYRIDEVRSNANYFCQVSDVFDNSETVRFDVGVDSHLTARAAGNISSITVNRGDTATLTVEASSDAEPLTYQWYQMELTSSSTGNVMYSRRLIPDANEASYTTDANNSKNEYLCEITDSSYNNTTVWFRVSVDTHLTASPAGNNGSIRVALGETATLTVEASSDAEPLSYQWYEEKRVDNDDGSWYYAHNPIDGAVEPTYAVAAAKKNYYCRVSDACGNTQDVWFNVSVDSHLEAHARDNQSNLAVALGESAELAVEASSDAEPLSYQWYEAERVYNDDGSWYYARNQIDGAVEATYVVPAVNEQKDYECQISDPYGNTCGIWFNVSIDSHLEAHAKDNQNNLTVAYGEPAELVVEASSDAEPLSYQWYEEGRVYNDDGSWYYTHNQIEGAEEATYTVPSVNERTEYCCRVSDPYGNTIDVWFYVSVDTHLEAHARDHQNDLKVALGEPAELIVEASSDAAQLSYQWYEQELDYIGNGSWNYGEQREIEGAEEATYTVPAVNEQKEYYCCVSDPYGNTTDVWFYVSVDTHLEAHARDNQNDLTVAYGEPAELVVEASCDAELSYQWYEQELSYTGNGSWSFEETHEIEGVVEATYTAPAVNERKYYYCRVSDPYGNTTDVWFYVLVDTHLDAHARDNQNDLKVALGESTELVVEASSDAAPLSYQWYEQERVYTENGSWNYGETHEIAGAVEATYTVPAVNEWKEYYCHVSDSYGYTDDVRFYVSVDSHLEAHAKDYQGTVLAEPGEAAELIVEASCDAELSYQWFIRDRIDLEDGSYDYDNFLIEGAVEASYSATDVDGPKQYFCCVSDPYGNTDEVWFSVWVDTHLEAHAKDNQNYVSVALGEPTELVVEASCDAALSYQWYEEERVNNDDGSWYYRQNLIEGAVEDTYTVPAVNERKVYYCHVSDPYGYTQEVWIAVSVDTE